MASYRRVDWYALPRYYDIAFAARTPAEADFLEGARARHARSRGRRVLEPACGSGRLVAELSRRGYRVRGYDASRAMVGYARRRARRAGLGARIGEGRMESCAPPGSYDLAHCLVSSFKYLLTEDDARAHLASISRSLAPGGIYVLGLHLTDYADRAGDRERWSGARRGVRVQCTIDAWPPDRRRRRERLRSRLTVTRPGGTERYETTWWFRTYSAGQFRSLLASVPALEHVATYDFHYELDRPVRFGGDQLDQVVILRRARPR